MEKKPKRRSPEERQEISELVKSIRNRVKKFEVTSYELSQVVDMTMPGLDKILKGTTKLPDLGTLKQIDAYLFSQYESTDGNILKEDSAKYEAEPMGIPEIMKKLKVLEDKIDKATLKQDIIFEILKNGKAAELSYITKMAKEKINSLPERNL